MSDGVPRRALSAKIIRTYLRTGLRGRTRLPFLASRYLKALQAVAIHFADRNPVYVDLRDGYAHWLLSGDPWEHAPWETAEQKIMRHFVSPGDVAFDIGANLGLHSALLSRLIGPSGTLHVFEVNPALLPNLALTIAGLGNAVLHSWALSNSTGRTAFFVPQDHTKASLANWLKAFGEDVPPITCEQRRMDDLVLNAVIPYPNFIKCDVEGAELLVFQGARSSLDRRDAPILLFEANAANARGFGLTILDAVTFLKNLVSPQYHFFEVLSAGGCLHLKSARVPHFNVLAVPDSKLSRGPELIQLLQ
jgi:FkbM family methyltransferase